MSVTPVNPLRLSFTSHVLRSVYLWYCITANQMCGMDLFCKDFSYALSYLTIIEIVSWKCMERFKSLIACLWFAQTEIGPVSTQVLTSTFFRLNKTSEE